MNVSDAEKKNYKNFIIKKFNSFKDGRNVEFGKTYELLKKQHPEIPSSEKESLDILFNTKHLDVVSKEEQSGETRFVLYYVLTPRKGYRYAITFRDGILRIITMHKIGIKTIRKYLKHKKLNKVGMK